MALRSTMQEDAYRRKFVQRLRSDPSFAFSEFGWTEADAEHHIERYHKRTKSLLQVEVSATMSIKNFT